MHGRIRRCPTTSSLERTIRASTYICRTLWLRDVVAQLPDSERAQVRVVYLEGLSPEQAAERLGTTRNNIDQRLFHARKRLRELMDDDD